MAIIHPLPGDAETLRYLVRLLESDNALGARECVAVIKRYLGELV